MDSKNKIDIGLENHHKSLIPSLIMWVYAFVLFVAAALIFILYEKIFPINIYLVYISLGVILGLCIVIVLNLVLKK